MDNSEDKIEDPSTANFIKLAIIVAAVLLFVGIVVLLLGKLVVGGIIALLGAVFGVGSRVAKVNKL